MDTTPGRWAVVVWEHSQIHVEQITRLRADSVLVARPYKGVARIETKHVAATFDDEAAANAAAASARIGALDKQIMLEAMEETLRKQWADLTAARIAAVKSAEGAST